MNFKDLNVKVIYLSGPITSRQNGFRDAFKQYETALREQGYYVLNPAEQNTPYYLKGAESEEIWKYFMRESLKMMLDADCILMLPGWEDSKGAQMEYNLAQSLELPVYHSLETMGVWDY